MYIILQFEDCKTCYMYLTSVKIRNKNISIAINGARTKLFFSYVLGQNKRSGNRPKGVKRIGVF